MNKPVAIIGGLVFALLVAGAAFWGGMNVGKAQAQDSQNATSNFFASRGFDPNNLPSGTGGGQGTQGGGVGANGQGGQGAGTAARQRGAFGTVTKIDGDTLSITDFQGNAVNVTLSASTAISKTVSGTKDDLKVGTDVVVQGDRSGNNVSATSVQIGTTGGGPGGFFGGNGAGRRNGTPTPTK